MNEVSKLKLARLSPQDRAMVKAGVLDPDTMQLTPDGKNFLIEILFDKFRGEVANALISVEKEEKESKTNKEEVK